MKSYESEQSQSGFTAVAKQAKHALFASKYDDVIDDLNQVLKEASGKIFEELTFFAFNKLKMQEKSEPMRNIFKSLGKPFLLFDSDISDHLSRYLPGSRMWLHDAVRQFVNESFGNSDTDTDVDCASSRLQQLSVAGGAVEGVRDVKAKKKSAVFWLCADAGNKQYSFLSQ